MKTETYTNDSGVEIQVHFDELQYELLESDPEERMTVYICKGEDSAGNHYTGNATYFCDELDSIDEIELMEVEYKNGRHF